ncbi:MAG: hypothetical protein GY755_08615 [Chloroflexi bacterium]|nr:hypothetical protein [Chloroflexota bacterium]
MIIWRRQGWLVPILFIATMVMFELAVNFVAGDSEYYSTNQWTKITAILVGSVLVGIVGFVMNSVGKDDIYIDEETNEEYKLPRHEFFFIPFEYWAFIIPILFYFKPF